jgi:hypothetical protein
MGLYHLSRLIDDHILNHLTITCSDTGLVLDILEIRLISESLVLPIKLVIGRLLLNI